MYNVGVFPLKAFPPHRGHLKQIQSANSKCMKLYIVVSDSEERAAKMCFAGGLPLIPLALRLRWMQQEFKDMENICLCILDETGLPPYPGSSEVWNKRLNRLIPEKIDVIFGGDEAYRKTFSKYNPDVIYACMDRNVYPISSTQIRGDVERYFEYILDAAKPFFKEWLEMRAQKGPAPITPKVAADAVIMHEGNLVIIERDSEPFGFAFPGGFMNIGETVKECCVREAREETGLHIEVVQMIGYYDQPDRDFRGQTVSFAFLCRSVGGVLERGDDAKSVGTYSINEALKLNLVLKHDQILQDALDLTTLSRRIS